MEIIKKIYKDINLNKNIKDETKYYQNILGLFYNKRNFELNDYFYKDHIEQILLLIKNNKSSKYKFVETEEEKQKNKEQTLYLKKQKFFKQRTKEWFKKRKTCLTASNINKLDGSENDKIRIIIDKCKPLNMDQNKFFASKPCIHGNQFEDVAEQIFSIRNTVKVYSFGCIVHEHIKYLGASPDGIDENGEMLEIKCPYSRTITGICKEVYYKQIQLQLAVANLNICNFLEIKFVEYDNPTEFYLDYDGTNENKQKNGLEKGVLIKIIKNNNERKYIYHHINYTYKKIKHWISNSLYRLKRDDKHKHFVSFEVIYWKVTKYSCVKVFRDYDWFPNILSKSYKLWFTILNYRKNGKWKELEQNIKKNKKKKNIIPKGVCLISDSDSE